MKKNYLVLAMTAGMMASSQAAAFGSYFDARNDGMGGIGVATTHYGSAAMVNPALVSKYDESDDFSLVLPTIGVQVSDQDDLIDNLDGLSDRFDAFDADVAGGDARVSAGALADKLRKVDGKHVGSNVGLNAQLTIPTRWASVGVFANAYGDVVISTDVDSADLAMLDDIASGAAPTPAITPELNSEARAVAALVQDYGVAVARAFDVKGQQVHIGVTPKIQKIDTFNYSVRANEFEEDDIDAGEFRSSE